MRKFAGDVGTFNREILGIPVREKSLLSKEELEHLSKCLNEETKEFNDAHRDGDLIAAVDALIDLMYFAAGGFYKMGITPEEADKCSDIVHSCNMRKKFGVVDRRANGSADAVKPEGWKSPEQLLAEVLGGKQ